MAVPLEPESGLFPDLDVPPFVHAPELEALAQAVLRGFDEFRAVRRAVDDETLVVGYVWETKPFDPLKDELKPHTIAKVTRASALWRALAEVDLVIQFRRWFWDRFTDEERRGVLHHEWSHVVWDGKLSLREHDVEEFARTARRFGPRRGHHAELFKAFLDWQHEQERPEPPSLHPVAADDACPFLGCALEADHRGDHEVPGPDEP